MCNAEGGATPSSEPTSAVEKEEGEAVVTDRALEATLDQGALSGRNRGTEAERSQRDEGFSANGDCEESRGGCSAHDDDNESARRPPPETRRELVHTFYLSNDDSMSLSSAQRIEYAIEKGLPVPRAHIRPHELLNYYTFEPRSKPARSSPSRPTSRPANRAATPLPSPYAAAPSPATSASRWLSPSSSTSAAPCATKGRWSSSSAACGSCSTSSNRVTW